MFGLSGVPTQTIQIHKRDSLVKPPIKTPTTTEINSATAKIESKTRDIHDYLDIYLDPVVAIATFILSYFLAKIITDRQEKNKLTSLFNYFNLYLINQNKAIDRQIEEIKKQKDAIKELSNTDGITISIINQPYYILDTINKEALLDAWTKIGKKEAQKYFDIISHIELTRKIFQAYKDYHTNFLQRLNGIRQDWNTKLSTFTKLKHL